MTISKTAALRQARRYIKLERFGRQWVIARPWSMADPAGPWTTSQPFDWFRARGHLTSARAEYALQLLGHGQMAIDPLDVWGSLGDIVTRQAAWLDSLGS